MTESQYQVLKEMITKYENDKLNDSMVVFDKLRIFELGVSNRLNNVLYRSGVLTVGDLRRREYFDILSMKGYGKKLHLELTELFKRHKWKFPKYPY